MEWNCSKIFSGAKSSQSAFYVNLWRPDVDLRRMLAGEEFAAVSIMLKVTFSYS